MRKKGSGQKHARGNLSSLTRIAEAFVTFVTAREKGARGDTHYVSPSLTPPPLILDADFFPLRYRRYHLSFYSLSFSLAASLESRRSERAPYPGRLVRSTLSRSSQRANHRRWNIHSRRRNNTNTCCTQNSCRASSSLERFLVASCLPPSPLPHIDLDPLTAFRFVSISIRSPKRSRSRSLLSSGCPFNLLDSTMGHDAGVPGFYPIGETPRSRDENGERFLSIRRVRGKRREGRGVA